MRLKAKERDRINDKLQAICKVRHPHLPLKDVGDALAAEGLKIEDAIYCGREGRANMDLFRGGEEISNAVLVMYWLKGDVTSTYEFNAYVS